MAQAQTVENETRFGEPGEGVAIAVAEGIAQVRLDRPAKHNALSPPMWAGLRSAIDWLGEAEGVNCVVLAGEGPSFCAGIDLAAMMGEIRALGSRIYGLANDFQQPAWGWRTLPMPVIAALHGHCYGGGLQIALGADVRIAHPETKLAIMEMKHGIVPDMGLFALARGLVRDDALRELTYTARPIDAPTARDAGLVTRLADDPLAEATALAKEIAGKAPAAIRAAKRLAGMTAEADEATILQAESDEQEALIKALFGGRGA